MYVYMFIKCTRMYATYSAYTNRFAIAFILVSRPSRYYTEKIISKYHHIYVSLRTLLYVCMFHLHKLTGTGLQFSCHYGVLVVKD